MSKKENLNEQAIETDGWDDNAARHDISRRKIYAAAFVSLFLNVVLCILSVVSWEYFGLFIVVGFACIFIGMPMLIVSSIIYLVLHLRKSSRKRFAFYAILVSLVVLASVFSIPISSSLHLYNVSRAKEYCETLVPTIETFRSEHERYPDRLDELADIPKPPYLLRKNSNFYEVSDNGYAFYFPDPMGFMSYYRFNPKTESWEIMD